MRELDRPEAAVGDDQVAGAGGAGQRVGEAAFSVSVAAEAGIEDSVRSDLGEDHRPDLGESEGDAACGGGAVEGVAVAGRIRKVELGAVQGEEPQTSPPCAGRVRCGERAGHLAEHGLQHVLAEAGPGPA
ncbi:hypothetical protein AB0K47_19180 [Streptomyces tirandamycinicus]|uniref:hypothetical protein n=1 Tax=Streptomyces tirandamycinicus TaxID=2174846 RepID=UPI003413E870